MFLLRQAARKSEQTKRAGDKKSHKAGSSHQVNTRLYPHSINTRAWLFDYEVPRKSAAQRPRGSVVSNVLGRGETEEAPAHGDVRWPGKISCALVTSSRIPGWVQWRFDVAHALWF